MKRNNSEEMSHNLPSKTRSSDESSSIIVRFLIPRRAAGIMIGKGGENIKRIRSQDLLNAKTSDPKRIMGNPPRKSRNDNEEEESDENMLDYRILVHESQAGAVIGRGGDRIKELRRVYEMRAPMSTDRVVQIVAEPDSAMSCLQTVLEAVEDAPPRGRRADYNIANYNESQALNYGGWLSPEAIDAYSRGGMPPPPSFFRNSYGNGNGQPPRGGGGMHQQMRGGRDSFGSQGGPPGYGYGNRGGEMYGDGYNYMPDPTAYPGPQGPVGYDSGAPGRTGGYAGWGSNPVAAQNAGPNMDQWSGGWS